MIVQKNQPSPDYGVYVPPSNYRNYQKAVEIVKAEDSKPREDDSFEKISPWALLFGGIIIGVVAAPKAR